MNLVCYSVHCSMTNTLGLPNYYPLEIHAVHKDITLKVNNGGTVSRKLVAIEVNVSMARQICLVN